MVICFYVNFKSVRLFCTLLRFNIPLCHHSYRQIQSHIINKREKRPILLQQGFYRLYQFCILCVYCTVNTVNITLLLVIGNTSGYASYILCKEATICLHCYSQQIWHTHSNFNFLCWPGAVKVTGMGTDFFIAGLNLNIITFILK